MQSETPPTVSSTVGGDEEEYLSAECHAWRVAYVAPGAGRYYLECGTRQSALASVRAKAQRDRRASLQRVIAAAKARLLS
jgi:hypothetical protein